MNKLIIISTAFVFICIHSFSQSGDSLVYSENKSLTWNDYKGIPNSSERSLGFKLSYTINMIRTKVNWWSGCGTYVAYAIVDKDSSWVLPGFRKDQYLAHDRIHFDIAEIYALKLEKALNYAKINVGNRKEINFFFYSYVNKMKEEENRLDQETQFGNDTVAQKKWYEDTKSQLQSLK